MGKYMKKVFSLLLALLLMLPLLGGTARAAGKTMVYFENTCGWEKIYCYYWSEADYSMTMWPGERMKHEASAYYSLEIPAWAEYVVFSSDSGAQTVDLILPGSGYMYQPKSGQWSPYTGCFHSWNEGVILSEPGCTSEGNLVYTCTLCSDTYMERIEALGHDYRNGICDRCGKERPEDFVVYFRNTEGWENVYYYYWNRDNSPISWPGYPMIHVDQDIYRAVIPRKEVFVIFNDGGNQQTSDLFIPGTGGYLYDMTTAQWEPYSPDCHHSWDSGVRTGEPGCETAASILYTCTLCAQTMEQTLSALGHDYNGVVCRRCGKELETVTVYLDVQTAEWYQAMAYWWGTESDLYWPGTAMVYEGGTLYSVQVPADAEGLLFNDGKGGQTQDLQLPGDGYVYCLDSGEWVGYGDSGEQLVTIYFNHAFNACGSLTVGYSTDSLYYLPMDHVGGTVYSAKVPADAYLWFECDCGVVGSASYIPGDGYMLYPADHRWVPYNGCAHEWDEGQIRDQWSCEQDEVKVYSCLHCDEHFEMYRTAYGHDYVDNVCQNCGKEVPDTITLYLSGAESLSNAYAYIWNKNEQYAAWPGLQMKKQGDLFSVEIPGDYQYIIFSDGHDVQTEKMNIPGDGYIYDWQDGVWTEFLMEDPIPGTTVSGTIHTSDNFEGAILVTLRSEEAEYIVTAEADGSYVIEGVAPGSYTLEAVMDFHAPYSCEVTMEQENISLDANLNPLGDISGDGQLNILDTAKAYSHVKNVTILEDYAFDCADINGDGTVNVLDVAMMYAHVKGTNPLR